LQLTVDKTESKRFII